MNKHILKAFSGFLFGTAAVLLNEHLKNYFGSITSAGYTIFSLALIYIYIDPIICNLPRSIRFLRIKFDTFSDTEGIWIEDIDNDTYSVVEIRYAHRRNEYTVHGANFSDKNYEYIRSFSASKILIESIPDKVLYYYVAQSGFKRTDGIGLIEFTIPASGLPDKAAGFFADQNQNIRHNFIWHRIPIEDVMAVTGRKRKIRNVEDQRKILTWYLHHFRKNQK